jgi:hypothetical protein
MSTADSSQGNVASLRWLHLLTPNMEEQQWTGTALKETGSK